MKKILFLLVLIIISLQSFTQDFAPVGAIWHYTQSTIDPDVTSFKTFESISTSIINGVQCSKMIEVERYLDTISFKYHYMHSKNDSVFFFADNDFHLLYDFGANSGDTIILNYFETGNGTPLQMIIDSTGIIMVSGQERKIQYITSGDGFVIEFGRQVIEGIGNTYFMFPTYDGTMNGPLRCYQDNNIDIFLNPFHGDYGWNQQDCEEIITSVEEMEFGKEVVVYPNPIKSNFSVINLHHTANYKILNINGNLLKQGIISASNTINIEELPQGIYFIELKNEDFRIVKKIIKK